MQHPFDKAQHGCKSENIMGKSPGSVPLSHLSTSQQDYTPQILRESYVIDMAPTASVPVCKSHQPEYWLHLTLLELWCSNGNHCSTVTYAIGSHVCILLWSLFKILTNFNILFENIYFRSLKDHTQLEKNIFNYSKFTSNIKWISIRILLKPSYFLHS